MLVYVINPTDLTLSEQTVSDDDTAQLDALQAIVGGLIENVAKLPRGDLLHVSEEGLLHGGRHHWFALKGFIRAFTGCAFIVGRHGHNFRRQPKHNIVAVQTLVQWLEPQEARKRLEHCRRLDTVRNANLRADGYTVIEMPPLDLNTIFGEVAR